ncbi:MAG: hemerythrin domain-containing protein [Anaerolineales bacterium]|nr:hemerythrin domain-containing protein [Anaerolineales bacterium]
MKRHPALQDLSRDHQQFLLHARGLRWALDGNRHAQPLIVEISRLLDFWEATGASHFIEEESVVIPACEQATVDLATFARQILRDHSWLRARVERLRDENLDLEAIAEFAQHLHDHIRFEERVIFEGLQAALSEADLQALSQRLQEARAQRPDPNAAI